MTILWYAKNKLPVKCTSEGVNSRNVAHCLLSLCNFKREFYWMRLKTRVRKISHLNLRFLCHLRFISATVHTHTPFCDLYNALMSVKKIPLRLMSILDDSDSVLIFY